MKYSITDNVGMFREAVKEASSFEEVRVKMGYKKSGGLYDYFKRRCRQLEIDFSHFVKMRPGPVPNYEIDMDSVLREVVGSTSIRDLSEKLGIPYDNNGTIYRKLKEFLETNNVDCSHFTGSGWNKNKNRFNDSRIKIYSEKRRCDDKDVFCNESNKSLSSISMIERLVLNGTMQYKCDICGVFEWLGQAVRLHLDHIDGDRANNGIENLRLLCPNCHSQTSNYAIAKGRIKTDKFERLYSYICGRTRTA